MKKKSCTFKQAFTVSNKSNNLNLRIIDIEKLTRNLKFFKLQIKIVLTVFHPEKPFIYKLVLKKALYFLKCIFIFKLEFLNFLIDFLYLF